MANNSSNPGRMAAVVTRRRVVERAESFLRENLSEPIALGDLCAVTGVSERSLRNAFHDVYGVSPKQYMLQARLAQVHAALSSGAGPTVTTVATDHGFFELGRFACRYKATYGQHPSATLRAAVGAAA
jgi:AraC family ethanolamine operon transcriptional activator